MPSDIQYRVDAYLDLMLERVELCKYPSNELLDRIERALVLFYDADGGRRR